MINFGIEFGSSQSVAIQAPVTDWVWTVSDVQIRSGCKVLLYIRR